MKTACSLNLVYADFKPEYEAAVRETDQIEYYSECPLDFGSLDAPIIVSAGSSYGWKPLLNGRAMAMTKVVRRAGE